MSAPEAPDAPTVARREHAAARDRLWFCANVHARERIWRLVRLDRVTKLNLFAAGRRFQRQSGRENGLNGLFSGILCGALDRPDFEILERRHKIAAAVRECDDAEVMRQVAALVRVDLSSSA